MLDDSSNQTLLEKDKHEDYEHHQKNKIETHVQ